MLNQQGVVRKYPSPPCYVALRTGAQKATVVSLVGLPRGLEGGIPPPSYRRAARRSPDLHHPRGV